MIKSFICLILLCDCLESTGKLLGQQKTNCFESARYILSDNMAAAKLGRKTGCNWEKCVKSCKSRNANRVLGLKALDHMSEMGVECR